MATIAQELWTIVAVAGDGDEARFEDNPHSPLRHLLDQAVRRLYGQAANPSDYEMLIAGTVQTDLEISLQQAGLRNGAEVVVQPRDVSKG